MSEFKEDWGFRVNEGEEERFGDLGLFWYILEILGTNLNIYKIALREMIDGTNMTCGMPRAS